MAGKQSERIRLTKTLIDSLYYGLKSDDGWKDFIKTLNREPIQPTKAMLDGIAFEGCVNSVLDGEVIEPDHEWYKPVTQMARYLRGSQQQVTLFRELTVDGRDYLIHGVLDYLRAGVIFDCKFSKTYHLNKYLDTNTTQTQMYLYLVPEARQMEYLISDGNYVYRERYPREIVPPLEPVIRNFVTFCENHGLYQVLLEKWRVNQ